MPHLLISQRTTSTISFAADFDLPPPPTPLHQRQRDALDFVAVTDFGMRYGGKVAVPSSAQASSVLQVTAPDDESDYFGILQSVYDYGEAAAMLEEMGNAIKNPGANVETTRSKMEPTTPATNNTGTAAPKATKSVHHPLLRVNLTNTTTTTSMSSLQNYGTMPSTSAQASSSKPSRPSLPHAHTTTASAPRISPSNNLTTNSTTQLARPTLPRATSSTDATIVTRETLERSTAQRNTAAPARPSLLRSLTTALTPNLDLHHKTSHTTRHAPVQPSHWTAHAHRSTLLVAWDNIHSSSTAQPPRSLTAQLAATEMQMLAAFPELGTGEVVLGKEWIIYVLGTGLRAPFYSGETMGRWEVLGGIVAGGGKGAWGMM